MISYLITFLIAFRYKISRKIEDIRKNMQLESISSDATSKRLWSHCKITRLLNIQELWKKNDRFVWSSHSSSINIYKFILEKVWIHRLHLFLKCPICAFAIIVHWAYNRGDHYQMTILHNFLILQCSGIACNHDSENLIWN